MDLKNMKARKVGVFTDPNVANLSPMKAVRTERFILTFALVSYIHRTCFLKGTVLLARPG